MNKNQSTGIIVIVAIILIALLSIAFEGPQTSTSEISYSQFLNKVQMGTIESVVISKDTLVATPKESGQTGQNDVQTTKKTQPEGTQNNKVSNPLNINNLTSQKIPKVQFKVQIPEADDDLYELLHERYYHLV